MFFSEGGGRKKFVFVEGAFLFIGGARDPLREGFFRRFPEWHRFFLEDPLLGETLFGDFWGRLLFAPVSLKLSLWWRVLGFWELPVPLISGPFGHLDLHLLDGVFFSTLLLPTSTRSFSRGLWPFDSSCSFLPTTHYIIYQFDCISF